MIHGRTDRETLLSLYYRLQRLGSTSLNDVNYSSLFNCRANLDAGAPSRDLPGSVYSVAEALLLLLDALPEPVVPFTLYSQTLQVANQSPGACKAVLDQLPDHHRNVFTYLIAFMKELLVNKEENKLDAMTLAMVFGHILIRTPPTKNKSLSSHMKIDDTDKKKQAFVLNFIVNDI